MPCNKAFLVPLSLTLALTPPATSVSTVAQVEARYRSARTLQATFLERYLDNGRIVRAEAGVAYFRKPGRMRWNYESPDKSEFVVDGKTAWFYVPSDRTVTRVPAKKSEDWRTPLSLLAGEMKFSRVCAQVRLAQNPHPVNPGDEVFACTPKGSADPATQSSQNAAQSKDAEDSAPILIEVSPQSGELARILVNDPGGTSIEFRFRNWQFNPALPEALFHFQLPVGVAIVNGELPARYTGVNP